MLLLVLAFAILTACAGGKRFHAEPLPDPKSFNAHFGDMDADGNDRVDWKEFQNHFPHAKPGVFTALDLNADGAVDHEEWHRFKKAHGLKHVK